MFTAPPFYGGQQRSTESKPLPSLPAKAWHILPGPQDSVQSRCQMLGNPSQRVCAHVCCSGTQARGSQGFWEGNPQFTPVSSLPTSGQVCRGPWLQDTAADRWTAGIGLFCGPQLHSPSGEWVCVMVQGGRGRQRCALNGFWVSTQSHPEL